MPQAHWTQKAHLFDGDEYVCSRCGHSSPKPYSTCPHCGADMTGQKYEATYVDEAEDLNIIFGDF